MAEFAYRSDQWVACYHPLKGYFGKEINALTGKRGLVFSLNEAFSGIPVEVPCGQCIGCKLERSRQWALRIVHEKRMHSESAFLTLTYRPECIPAGSTLVLRDLQLFMKRLRKRRAQGLRFYACGEYGEVTRRPHYHVLLLNTSFPDMKFWKHSGDNPLYVSSELTDLWPTGDHFIGEVSFQSAAYVARYCTKKITGDAAEGHYGGRLPEFTCMSRRPGIGLRWFEAFHGEAYRNDSAIADGREVRLPRYYDEKFELVDGKRLKVLKRERKRQAVRSGKADSTPERRRVREQFEYLKLARFKREK